MKQIIYFEWKKIITTKMNQISMLAGLGAIFLLTIIGNSILYYDTESNTSIKGIEGIQYSRIEVESFGEYITDENIEALLLEWQEQISQGATEEDVYMNLAVNNASLYALVGKHYNDMNHTWEGWSVLNQIKIGSDKPFYERRMEKIENGLNMEYPYGNYSEEEKAFWIQKAQKVTIPFRWGFDEGWKSYIFVIQAGFYLFFVLSICIAPVFSNEYRNKTDAIILTTKYGKTKLIWAKIIASYLFYIAYFLVSMTICLLANFMRYGLRGWNLPIQLSGTVIPYNWTYFQTVLVGAGIMFLLGGAVVSMTLLLSARVKSSFTVLLLDFLLLAGPALLSFSKKYRWWNRLFSLSVVQIMDMSKVLRSFNSYQIGSLVISYFGMIVICYSIVILVSIFLIPNGFRKHQVGTR